MSLFFRNSQIRQQVQDGLWLNFELPGQFVDTNHMVTLGRIPLLGIFFLLHGFPFSVELIAFSRNTVASRAHGRRFQGLKQNPLMVTNP